MPQRRIIQNKQLAYQNHQYSSRKNSVHFFYRSANCKQYQINCKKSYYTCRNLMVRFYIFKAVHPCQQSATDNNGKYAAGQNCFSVLFSEYLLKETPNNKCFHKTYHKRPSIGMFRKYENTAGKRHDRQEDQKHRKNQCFYSGAFLYDKIADCKNGQDTDRKYHSLIIIEVSCIIFVNSQHMI